MSFQAILFDCDGVLVDSEGITNRIIWQYMNEHGWYVSEAECYDIFLGKTVRSETALIEANLGRSIDDTWMQEFYRRRNIALLEELTAIEDSHLAVQAAYGACQGNIACASAADLHKVCMQLDKVQLKPFFKAVLSGHNCPRNKPYPDVYWAAAQALNADIAQCLIIEDSVTGIQAGVAAGATVWAYLPENSHFNAETLQLNGAKKIFSSMKNLEQLIHEHFSF
ncbi:HAD family hydrolase [Vitreoscilla stercoraria]|uniref:HAD family phosphatase n=1 Tax=Vitreoscilla stercoraria TaxID=61 RepID=A0ABY4EAY4_VITST|nr:HAD family phosphatase [Vitreoscilla stercoraria]UOO91728.1 HAD family phosphatase [Vitreoscilla stercoraria]